MSLEFQRRGDKVLHRLFQLRAIPSRGIRSTTLVTVPSAEVFSMMSPSRCSKRAGAAAEAVVACPQGSNDEQRGAFAAARLHPGLSDQRRAVAAVRGPPATIPG